MRGWFMYACVGSGHVLELDLTSLFDLIIDRIVDCTEYDQLPRYCANGDVE